MRIFDIHTHVYPDAVAQKATDSVKEFYGIPGAGLDGKVSTLLQQGQKVGISGYLILPVAIRPDRVHGINDYILQQTQLHPEFVGFGSVHVAMDGIGEEARRIMDMGLKGIKMHPDCQRFHIDDPRLYPLYEAVAGKIPIMFHMGDQRYDYSHPLKLRKILDQFPQLQAVAAHFGGYSMYETAYEFLKDTDCIFDISSSIMFMEDGIPDKFINLYGAERMAYGTDYPLWDPAQEVERFLQLKLRLDQLEQIAWKTAHRFLKL